jgi:hypothetical protein
MNLDIFTEGSQTEIRRSPDPNYKLVVVAGLSKIKSINQPLSISFMKYEDTAALFKDSEAVDMFYNNPSHKDQCLIVCLYEETKHDIRRRMAICQYPSTLDDIKGLVKGIASTLGIHLNFHENLKINAVMGSLSAEKSSKSANNKNDPDNQLKEREYFLSSLIESFYGAVEDPDSQLEKIKEELLYKAVHTSNYQNAVIGRFLQDYLDYRKGLYQVAHNFGNQLLKTNLKLASKYLRSTLKTTLLEFPFKFKFADFYLRHAFVSINKTETGKLLTVVSAKYVGGKWDGNTFFSSTVQIDSTEDIENSLKETSKFFYDSDVVELKDLSTYHDFIKFCLKCLIYIESSEPDITPVKAAMTDKKGVTKLRKFFKYNCPFDITKLGYGFHGRNYQADKWAVSGHFRWQLCGPKLSQVKLLWIDEHESGWKNDN